MDNLIDKEFFDLLVSHIVKITDENDNEIPFNTITQIVIHKRFAYKNTVHFLLDNKYDLSDKNTTYYITYNCRCGRQIKILYFKYFMKTRISCVHCSQDKKFPDNKIANTYGSKPHKKKIKHKVERKYVDMDDAFKNKYLKSHLTETEFYKYLPYMYSIDDIVLTDELIKKAKYYFALPCNNLIKFTSKISFDNGKTLHIINIKLKCSICGKIHHIHTNNIRKKDINNIKCNKCNFANHIYTIKLYDDSGLTYQSNLEYDFIKKCKEKNIYIINGIEIPYILNGKNHTYISDFYLPEYKKIIELKANNLFYKKDLASGRIAAKNNAAIQFATENNLSFVMIMDSDIDEFLNTLHKEIV